MSLSVYVYYLDLEVLLLFKFEFHPNRILPLYVIQLVFNAFSLAQPLPV